MSKTIDQRVVEMQFDNANFERNVSTSMSTLEKLKKSLRFEDSAKGFESIAKAAGSVDMGGLGSGVESVRMKFSALEVMAVSALQNITNKAVDAGMQLVKSLSVDQIAEGWNKFTSKTSSVATLVAQGYELENVNEQLDRLNWFTDETSYNFTDMVSNIAKFTATGKGLEESVTAMEGIANWAALSGQNATTASHAMYQLSQAMGAGVMRKEDYKSIQNVSMDTDEFRQKALDAAVALGTLKKNADDTYESLISNQGAFTKSQFAEHLTQDAWFTSDVMMKVFGDYSAAVDQIYEYAEEKGITASQAIEELGDEVDAFGLKAFKAAQEARSWGDAVDSVKDAVSTGWMQSFELIFGNQEEATKLWTDLANSMYDVFASGGELRNELLSQWKELGGRDMLLESFWNSWNAFFGDGEEMLGLIGTIKEAFSEIFPPMTAERLVEITEKVRDLTEKFKMSEKTSKNLKSTFKGLFAVLDIGKQGLGALGEIAGHLLQKLLPVGEGFLDVTGGIGEFLVSVDNAIKRGDKLSTFVELFKGLIDKLADSVGAAKDYITTFAGALTGIDFGKFESFKDVLDAIGGKLKEFGNNIEATFPWVGSLQTTVTDAFKKIHLSADEELGATNTALEKIAVVGGKVKEVFSNLANKIGTFFAPIIEKIKSIFSDVTITDIIGTGLLAGIFKSIKKIAASLDDLLGGFKKIGDSLSGLLDSARDALVLWQKDIKANIILKIAGAVAMLAAALWVISKVDADRVLGSMGAITALLAEVTVVMAGIMKFGTKANALEGLSESAQFGKIATGMMVIAGAVLILAAALKKCEGLNWENSLPAMTSLFVLLGEMCGAMVVLSKIQGKTDAKAMKSMAFDMVIMALALKVLASAISKLGALDAAQVQQGTTALGEAMLAITAPMALLKSMKGNLDGVASSMLGMVAAITMLYVPISLFAKMDSEQLRKGGIAVAAGLTAMTIAVAALKAVPGDLSKVSASLLAMVTALTILILPVKVMGAMDLGSLARGLTGIMVSLVAMTGSLNVLSSKDTSGIGASMIALAAALTLLIVPIKVLGGMSWDALIKGMTGFAVAVGVLVIAAYAISPIADNLSKLAKAMVAFGVACIGVGIFVGAIALAFTTLATVGAAGVAAILAALTGLLQGFKLMLPLIGETLTDLVVVCCDVLKDTAPALTEAALYLIDELLAQIEAYTPSIVEHLARIIKKVGNAITENFGEITLGDWVGTGIFTTFIAATALLVKGFSAVAKDVPKALIGVAGVAAILVVVGGIITAMTLLEMDSVMAVAASLSSVLLSLSVTIALLGNMPLTAGLAAGLALGEFVGVMAAVMAALGGLNQIPGFSWLLDEGIQVLEQIGNGLGVFVGSIVGTAIERISAGVAESGNNLSKFMTNLQPFLDGARNIDSGVTDGIVNLTKAMLLISAAEIIDAIAGWLTGGTSLVDFGDELAEFGSAFARFSESVSGVDVPAVSAASEALKMIAEAAASIPNTGGVLSWIVGDNTLADFAEGLVPFGTALVAYGEAVNGIGKYITHIKAANEAADSVIAIASIVPNSGGLLGKIVGNNDLADFATGLVPFGDALLAYGQAVVGISGYIDEIEDSANAAEELIKIAEIVPNSGGLLGKIVGNNDLADFAKGIKPFGIALMEYGKAVDGISSVKKEITTSVRVADDVVKLADSVDNASGSKKLEQFGINLTAFAQQIKLFILECADLNAGQIENLRVALQSIMEIAADFSQIDVSAIESFVASMETIGETSIEEFLKSFTDSKTAASSAVATLVTNMSDAIKAKHETLKTKFADAAKAGLKGLTDKKADFKTAGSSLGTEIANGVTSQSSAIQTKFTTILSNCVAAIKGYYGQFQSAGSYLAAGVANGIAANTNAVVNASANMASRAAQAAKSKLKVNSPSRVGYEIGDYFGIGFTNGIADNFRNAGISGEELANSATKNLTAVVAKAAETIESDMDATPTIRPVLDLTEIQNGAAAMSGLMNSLSGKPVEGTVRIAAKAASSMNRPISVDSQPGAPSGTQNNSTTTNTFYITGTDPRAIADEVDRKLQRRVERRSAAWA